MLIICIGVLCFAGCGSPDSKKQQSESPADTVQNNVNEQADSTTGEAVKNVPHSDRQENTLTVSDTLKTRKYTPEADISRLKKKSGKLRYSGNEPFVVPTLFESDSSSYRIVADDTFMNETFKNLNGKSVILYGREQAIGQQKVLEVHYYQLFEK